MSSFTPKLLKGELLSKTMFCAIKADSRFAGLEKHLFIAIDLYKKSNNTRQLSESHIVLCDFCLYKKTYKDTIRYGLVAKNIAAENEYLKLFHISSWCLMKAFRKNGQADSSVVLVNDYLADVDSGLIGDGNLGVYSNQI